MCVYPQVRRRYESIVGEGDRKKSTIRSVGSKDAERPSKNYQDNLQELRDRIEKLESEKRNQNIRRNNNSGRCYICNSTEPISTTDSMATSQKYQSL
jgi:50S ribosomal subunit-associated GTPase HflX